MVALSDLVFLAKTSAGKLTGIAGNTVTVALATLAEGLSKTGNIDINAIGSILVRSVTIRNSGGSGVSLDVEGPITANDDITSQDNLILKQSGANKITLTGSPTAARTITFPDASGTVSLGASSGYIGSLTQAAILATTPSGFAWAFCNDTPGTAGGTTGAPVYWTPIPGVWLRYANDSPL
jgi:hypothetical protein